MHTDSSIFERFTKILCIGLEARQDRRTHIAQEFARVGIERFEWIRAYDKDSDAVMAMYRSARVVKYPPCFRCGKASCGCDNKKLFPAQVGNWLSHIAAWKAVEGDGLALICEDDVQFTDWATKSFAFLFGQEELVRSLRQQRPVLVRAGWALGDLHNPAQPLQLTQTVRMSNPCYAINAAMAGRLLEKLDTLSTTSDIYVHRIIGSEVDHYTLEPPAAYELSWSTGALRSEIRPKQKYIDHLDRQLASMEPSDARYAELLRLRQAEQHRLAQFDEFNEDAAGFDRERYPLL